MVTVHCLSTFASWPSPTVAISSGVATMDSGKNSATVIARASTGHSSPANSNAYPSSRQVPCSRSRVVSQAHNPGAVGTWCRPDTGLWSIRRSLRRSTQATGIPLRATMTSRGSPTKTMASAPQTAATVTVPTRAATPVTAPVSRYAMARQGQADSRKPGRDMACHTFRECMCMTDQG